MIKPKRQIWKAKDMDEGFRHALRGLIHVFKTQRNSRVILLIGLLAVVLGVYLKIEVRNLVVLIMGVGLLLVSEVFNSIVEEFGDFASAEFHPVIKRIKDISAAAVLVSVVIFLIVSSLILVRPILNYLQ